jgi:peptidoglycan glycosyltransferase
VSFSTALQHSINAVFCEIGKTIGPLTVLDYARKFGFYEDPPLETPSSERSPSGLYSKGRLFRPRDPNQVDPGRLAFGQERLQVTPLQMAMVAAGIANDGVVMEPYAVQKVTAPNGSTVYRHKPKVHSRPISKQTADELTAMMESVVSSGTGTAAQIPDVAVAGKTGTAETGIANKHVTWFIAFAPAGAPKVAVAVALENQTGFGATTAGPIAKSLVEAILAEKANT